MVIAFFISAQNFWNLWHSYVRRLNKRVSSLRNLLGPGRHKLIFDIGANVGNMSAAYACSGLSFIAFEPDPDNVNRLIMRFKFIPLITVCPFGVASKNGSLILNRYDQCSAHDTFSDKRANLLRSSVNPVLGVPVKPFSRMSVKMKTLDSLISEYGIPQYIKIDVEGFEVDVIRGLSCPVNTISFECNLPDFADEAVECVNLLCDICSDYCFNFFVSDHSFALTSNDWLSGSEVIKAIRFAMLPYVEIAACLGKSVVKRS